MRSSLIVLLVCLVWGMEVHAQGSELFKLWPDSALAEANSAADVDYMEEDEKQVVYYINLCRMNPALFADTFLKDFIKSDGVKKDKQVKELIKELESTPDRIVLEPSGSLTEVARKHAKDMGETGRTGHSASDGTPFKDRIDEVSKKFRGINENANYGKSDPMGIVVDLLIDRNVPNAGHRKNILDANMRFIGVAIEPHKRWKVNCVQDFGGVKK